MKIYNDDVTGKNFDKKGFIKALKNMIYAVECDKFGDLEFDISELDVIDTKDIDNLWTEDDIVDHRANKKHEGKKK